MSIIGNSTYLISTQILMAFSIVFIIAYVSIYSHQLNQQKLYGTVILITIAAMLLSVITLYHMTHVDKTVLNLTLSMND